MSTVEDELGNFLKSCAEVVKQGEMQWALLNPLLSTKVLKGEKISVGWWRRFLERQPNLTLRRGDSTHVRMDAVNQETMDQYFSLLGEVLMEHNLVDKPSQIYNVDESGVPLDPKPPNKFTGGSAKRIILFSAANFVSGQ